MNGVLLINLGTPDSPSWRDVYRYLIEFLTDPRVIDLPWLKRQLLVRGLIVPTRTSSSAQAYKQIWTDKGSPLLIHTKAVQKLLQERLGQDYTVEIAMRYQNPSLQNTLAKLQHAQNLTIIPLFPQYASATTGSIHQKIMELTHPWPYIPNMRFIDSFPVQPKMISAFCQRIQEKDWKTYDHLLFSFHGLPERQIKKMDRTNWCLQADNCCQTLAKNNCRCYSAQCNATARAIINQLAIPKDRYSISFQSRLGKDPWLQPYTTDTISRLLKQGNKKILVACPAFVCDCLETTYEIGIEYAHLFKQQGGEALDLVEGLNNHPLWVEALADLVGVGLSAPHPDQGAGGPLEPH